MSLKLSPSVFNVRLYVCLAFYSHSCGTSIFIKASVIWPTTPALLVSTTALPFSIIDYGKYRVIKSTF